MKTTTKLGAVLSLLLAAGCAHKAQYSSNDKTYMYPYGGTTTYENSSTTYNNSKAYSPGYSSSSTVNQTYSPSYSQNSTSVRTTGNDQVLITNIRQSLNNNPNLAEVLPNIQVSAQNGTIILNGTVPSEQQKQAVETMVKSTSGVLNVNNQLQVNLSPTASKSFDKSSRTYSGGAAAASGDVSGSLSTESKGSAKDSSASSSGASSSLSSTNQSGPSQGLPPTSDRQDVPRLYSTNSTGVSTAPQSSISGDRSTAVSAGVAASQSGTSTNQSATSQGGASQSGISGTQSGTAVQNASADPASKSWKDQSARESSSASTANSSTAGKSDNLSSAEHKDLSASADTGQKSSIYSNGPSASFTNNSSRSSLYTSTGGTGDTSPSSSNTVSQSGAENNGLSATGNAQSRRYRGSDTNSSTTASVAASTPGAFDVSVQGASQADQAVGQKLISELRADTSLAALLPTIRVKIDNGKATISGAVKSQEEKLRIETAVQKVTGITSVDDQLRLGTSPAPIK